MSSITPVSSAMSTTTTGATTGTTTGTTTGSQSLGQADFLKLLSVQFQSQDPMKPMDDTAFIAQMAQFTSLQQTQTLTQQMTQLRADQDLATANSYIGRQLTVDGGNGTTVTGNVTAVDASGAAPQLIINGKPYALTTVLKVEPGATATATASSTSTQPSATSGS